MLWIPSRFPRLRLSELAERFELRHEDRTPPGARVPNLWLVALWLLDVASAADASRRKGSHTGLRKSHRSDGRMTWAALFDDLGMDAKDPRGGAPEQLDLELLSVRKRVDQLVATRREHHQLVVPLLQVFSAPEHDQATATLVKYFTEVKLPKDLAQYRHRAKRSRGRSGEPGRPDA